MVTANKSPSKRAIQDTHKDGSRHYEVPNDDGTTTRLPSVTTILQAVSKPALINWMAKTERELVSAVSYQLHKDMHDAESKKPMSREAWLNTLSNRLGKEKAGHRAARKAADIGTQVHALAEWTLKLELNLDVGKAPELTTKAAENAFAAWVEWRDSVHLKPKVVEQTVWSREHGYAGTMDLLAEVNGVLSVVDWKTGKAVYPEARLQVVSYARAIDEMGHGAAPDAYVVRLPKVAADGFEAVRIPAEKHAPLFEVFLGVAHLWHFLEDSKPPRTSKHKPATTADDMAAGLLASLAKAKERGEVRELLEQHGSLVEQLQREAPERAREVEAFALAWEGGA